jgi:putative endonuclease
MTRARLAIGAAGERAAAAHLEAQGWRIVERNARTRLGELDLVALEGRTLVFAEVKALSGATEARAEQALGAIGARKRLQVRRLAREWLAGTAPAALPRYLEIRFDALGVGVDPHGGPDAVVHVRAAF